MLTTCLQTKLLLRKFVLERGLCRRGILKTYMEGILNQATIDQFVRQGYVRIDDAFPASIAREAREILWKDTGCDPNDSSTWTKPVIRLGWYHQPAFSK